MRRIKSLIAEIRLITPTILELVLVRKDGRDYPDFLPGQYATLSFPSYSPLRGERSFSIASSPIDKSFLRFGIRMSGKYTQALGNLRQGEAVNVGGPFGKFIFDPSRDQSAVFIAGGIGITPFLSMIRTATDSGLPNNLKLFYSVRSLDEAAYLQELQEMEIINPNFKAVYIISDGKFNKDKGNFFSGRITKELLANELNDGIWERTYFLCGPPPFMAAMKIALNGSGLTSKSNLMTERFGVGSADFIERGTPVPKYIFAGWGVAAAVLFGVVFRAESQKRSQANLVNQPVVTIPTLSDNINNNTASTNSSSSNLTNTAPQTVTQPTVTPQPIQQVPIRPRTTVS